MVVERDALSTEKIFPLPSSGIDNPASPPNEPQDVAITKPLSQQLLDEHRPPHSSIGNERDPIEAQVSQFLGDVTFPRSLLPAIQAITVERVSQESQAINLRFQEKPFDKKRYEIAGLNWAGKSPETDAELAKAGADKLYRSLTGSRQMAEFRREASELFNQYMFSETNKSGTSEAYFMRHSRGLWDRMSVFAKDYLTYGDDRSPKVDIDDRDLTDILENIKSVAEGISRVRQSGVIHLDRNEPNERFYRFNDLRFTFEQGKISSLRIDEGTARDEHSPLFSFILSERELEGIENSFDDGTMIGPFNVGVVFHEFGDAEHNIIIDLKTESWTNDQIFNFIGRYLKFLKTESRLEGTPAKIQIMDGGIWSGEAERILAARLQEELEAQSS